MKKSNSFIGLISIYVGLILFNFLSNQFFFEDLFTAKNSSLINAVARASLVDTEVGANAKPILFTIYSLICTQLTGIFWLALLLWYYWKIFDQSVQHSWKEAIVLTVKVSILLETILFAFFMYSLPSSVSDTMSQQLLNALALSIGSFNAAGIAIFSSSLSTEVLQSNFLIQMGIILGSGLGGLGIFVINELFAPAKLRFRLANPQTDWSLITKTAVLGITGLMSLCSLLFFFNEPLVTSQNQKLIETIAGSVFEVNAARGFGYYLVENYSFSSSVILLTSSVFGTSPFSTGGGITLLFFIGIIYLFSGKRKAKAMDWVMAYTLVKHLLIYSAITFSTLLMIKYFFYPQQQLFPMIYDQWMMFCSNHVAAGNMEVIDIFTLIFGRMSFVVSCHLTLRSKDYL